MAHSSRTRRCGGSGCACRRPSPRSHETRKVRRSTNTSTSQSFLLQCHQRASRVSSIAALLHDCCNHFPMQNSLKIRSSRPSTSTRPVMAPIECMAQRSSSAAISKWRVESRRGRSKSPDERKESRMQRANRQRQEGFGGPPREGDDGDRESRGQRALCSFGKTLLRKPEEMLNSE